MILIDGRESNLSIANFTNLEEVLSKLMEDESLRQRIVTDVLVDEETFSELYPHHAEDIVSDRFSKLELHTVSLDEMASDVVEELPKVIDIMDAGSRRVADLLRQADLAEGLEVLQDIISVSRDLLNTIQVLRNQYSTGPSGGLDSLGDSLGGLLDEIGDAMGNEDWLLVADLMEYELVPACKGWGVIISELAGDILAARQE